MVRTNRLYDGCEGARDQLLDPTSVGYARPTADRSGTRELHQPRSCPLQVLIVDCRESDRHCSGYEVRCPLAGGIWVHITSGMLFIVFSFRCFGGLYRSAIAISDLLEASVHLLVPEPGSGYPDTP
jgi:hypothetical protein